MKCCIVSITDVVPEKIFLDDNTMQGSVVSTVNSLTLTEIQQTVVQFYNGSNGGHFVCMLDFEDWGSEQCPRFAYYVMGVTCWRLVHVSSAYDWKKVDDSE